MSERWETLKVTFYGQQIKFQKPEMVTDDNWTKMVERLETAIRKGTEKMTFTHKFEDMLEGKDHLPHDITKGMSPVLDDQVAAAAAASEEFGDDELERYKADRGKAIDSFVFELAERIAMINSSGHAGKFIRNMLNFDGMQLKWIREKTQNLKEWRERKL